MTVASAAVLLPDAAPGADPLDAAREVLRRYWGYPDFRPGQDQAIRNVLSGGDSLTIMPTGGGKSLCYQVPGTLLPGVTLVVSPLISLMKDQVDALDAAGVPASFINSTLPQGEMAARLDAAQRGDIKLLYVAPERFDADGFRRRLADIPVSLLAVDEAHCVSEWGHDFRPSYLRLREVRKLLGDPPVAALTATATEEVRADIVRQLGLRDPAVLVTGFDRRNLVWHVLQAKNESEKDRLLLRLLKGRDGSAIIYASTRKAVDAITALLNGMGTRTVGYHAGLPDRDRKRIQDEFMSGAVRVVVATNAFGMGIDKPDVRVVIHYNLPGNLEAYYQEAGRAGRDGGDSDCVLLHAHRDKFTHEYFINSAYPPRRAVEGMMRALRSGCTAEGLFTLPIAELGRTVDGVKDDRQAASAVRVLEQFGLVRQSYGNGPQPVRVRLLARPDRISRELGERPAELGFLRALWKGGGGEALYRGAMLDWRMLDRAAGERGGALPLLRALGDEGFVEWRALTGEGVWVLDRETHVGQLPIDWRGLDERKRREEAKLREMQRYAYAEGCRRGFVLRYFGDPAAMKECGACDNCLGTSPVGGRAGGEPAEPRLRADRVRERLQALRAEQAKKAGGIPAQMVWDDALLERLAQEHPRRPEALASVRGVDRAFMDTYGHAVLSAVNEALDANRARTRVPDGDRPRTQRDRNRGALPPEPAGAAPPTAEQREVYGRLRVLRSQLAKEQELPAYCVFADKTLVELAKRHPTSKDEMRRVPGIGPAKIEKYGDAFLELLRQG
ncbi:MAG TPA: RecQ family ATP-dependent DNA helicase [Longimicrobium sp.]|jgi:ATP-dependent DNA helicase RecQ|uniref:RecQ family ATP-dependent DNA helicase n=1 Tax=Longimicrobium sp. TaxID=2029185 RepID=UPI002ED89914